MNELFDKEDWTIRKYRPMMAWMYMAICTFDFIIAPILFAITQLSTENMVQWQPLTMKAGGLFHLAMGAIIGVSAWSRGQEKMRYMESIGHLQEQYSQDDEDEPISRRRSRRYSDDEEYEDEERPVRRSRYRDDEDEGPPSRTRLSKEPIEPEEIEEKENLEADAVPTRKEKIT